MTSDSSRSSAHPPGEQSLVVGSEPPGGVDIDSFFGPVRVEWDHEAAMTPSASSRSSSISSKRPGCSTPSSSTVRCATAVPTPRRSATFSARRCSPCSLATSVTPISRRCAATPSCPSCSAWKRSSARIGKARFQGDDEKEGATWLRQHLAFCVEPLLAEPWILDVDTTIKPLYGHQEGAVLGYNPKKPGVRAIATTPLDGFDASRSRCRRLSRRRACIQT